MADLSPCARHGYREHRREEVRPGLVLVHLGKPLADVDDGGELSGEP